MPAVLADFLLRFDKAQWAMVTAVHENKLVASLRTSGTKIPAANMARRLFRDIGEGGGHRTKAGGFVPLQTASPAEIEKFRTLLRNRFLRALNIKAARAQRLVP